MSSNPKNNLLTIHMRKTKKRVTAATKLQALARGKHVRSQQKRQNKAVTKLQALARGKRDRRAATVKKQQKHVTIYYARAQYNRYSVVHELCPACRQHFQVGS